MRIGSSAGGGSPERASLSPGSDGGGPGGWSRGGGQGRLGRESLSFGGAEEVLGGIREADHAEHGPDGGGGGYDSGGSSSLSADFGSPNAGELETMMGRSPRTHHAPLPEQDTHGLDDAAGRRAARRGAPAREGGGRMVF